MIEVSNVSKSFTVPDKKQKGIARILFRKNKTVDVLKNISFSIKKGEFVGYVGSNGAGKSTSIKLMTGILYPTKGNVKVMNLDPYKQRYEYTYHMGVVFGQRSMLEYDIPVRDSFILYKAIYEIPEEIFQKRVKRFSKILKLDELLHVPVRKLSLGQRMRCEIAASLLHNPEIVFLDEPTIGLDALAKQEIRAFLKEINKEGTTIILTTHDMDDIEALCERIIFIHEGKIIFDGPLQELKKRFVTNKRVEVSFEKKITVPASLKKYLKKSSPYVFSIPQKDSAILVPKILGLGKVIEFALHEPRLEDVVKLIYEKGSA